jgi:hypothetical protein
MFGGGDKNVVILGGLSELMNRVGQIEEACLGSRAGMDDELGPDKSDKFLQLKYFITVHNESFLHNTTQSICNCISSITSYPRHHIYILLNIIQLLMLKNIMQLDII